MLYIVHAMYAYVYVRSGCVCIWYMCVYGVYVCMLECVCVYEVWVYVLYMCVCGEHESICGVWMCMCIVYVCMWCICVFEV